MTVLHKVTALEQLAFNATMVALRHHFSDRSVRWVFWTQYGGPEKEVDRLDTDKPIDEKTVVSLRYYNFVGAVHVPRLHDSFPTNMDCTLRKFGDGSHEACAIYSGRVSAGWKGPVEESLQHMSYWFGQRHPRGRSRDTMPKFLPTKLMLPPPRH